MTQARAFWITAVGQGKILAEQLPAVRPGDVVVRTLYSGISRGTEALVFRGEVPPSEWARMRAPHQAGDFPAPVKYGYASVGRVEAGPDSLVGRNVFCLWPHQDRYVVAAQSVLPLPPGLHPRRAVLAANFETAINALWDVPPRIGDRIAVVGAGTVGCLTAWLASRIEGTEVELVDLDPRKRAIAAALDVPFALPDAARREVDCVFHASGHPAGLVTALELAGFESTVADLSWYGMRDVVLPLGQAFHSRRLRLIASQVGTIPAAQRGRWTHARRLELALRLLTEPVLDALLTGEDAFESLPEVMPRLANGASGALCHVIRYG
jgi:2-desacetyl-2-hydroxyethyl bacteriochlorophyllide A dehydrogenase